MAWAIVGIFSLVFLIGTTSTTKIPKIVGGSSASIKDFPFIVSIRTFGDAFCAGSIISDRHILTAAHCVYGEAKEYLTINSGTSRTDREGNVHKILSIHIHPKYDNSNQEDGLPHDIAVITLEDPIVFNKYQQKINLPSHDLKNYQVAYVIGWGGTAISSYIYPKQLQKLRVALLPSDKCKRFITSKMTEKQICAFRSTTKGSCAGDSGGPLVAHGEIVAIVSRGDILNCVDGHPDINTNVFAYKDFIESVMNK